MRPNLKAARQGAGMTQQQAADALGITLRYYCRIEAGDRTGNYELWDKLEEMFGVSQRTLRAQAASRS